MIRFDIPGLAVCLVLILTGAGCDLFGGSDADPSCQIELEEGAPTGNIEPTGTLVFAAYRIDENGSRRDDGNIYTMDADGSNLRQLTAFGSEGGAINPAWSPDGQTIAFASLFQSTTLGPYLYLIDADGSNMRYLKRFPNESPHALVGWDPAWSPSGNKLAYSRCVNCGGGGQNYEIFVAQGIGKDIRPEDEIRFTNHAASDGGASWSPDGNMIAFSSNRAYLQSDSARFLSDLYVKYADGAGEVRRLTQDGYIGSLLWHPDKNQIVAGLNGKKNRGNLLCVDLRIGSTSRLAIDLSDPLTLTPVEWSPSGKRLLLGATSPQRYELYILDVKSRQTRYIPVPETLKLSGRPDWYLEEN